MAPKHLGNLNLTFLKVTLLFCNTRNTKKKPLVNNFTETKNQ